MENNEFKSFYIKNRTCYYFNDIIRLGDFGINNILIDKKSHGNIFIYDISCKILIRSKAFNIRPNKKDGYIRIFDGTRYLVLLCLGKYDDIYNRITYLINLKISITYIFSNYYVKIKNNFYDS